jgi:hypothetical protein
MVDTPAVRILPFGRGVDITSSAETDAQPRELGQLSAVTDNEARGGNSSRRYEGDESSGSILLNLAHLIWACARRQIAGFIYNALARHIDIARPAKSRNLWSGVICRRVVT